MAATPTDLSAPAPRTKRSLAPMVVAVAAGSAAAEHGIAVGDEIIRVNGVMPRDIIEWQLAADDAEIDLDVSRGGLELSFSIVKAAGESLGVEVSSAVFDRVRTCDNHCEFCFIYQLPKGMRSSLYLKDDDYRLSFLYGNFTTLTRFTEADLERVVTERLSPLHVSIHATDPDVRSQMLKNPRGGMSLRWLRALLDHGITVRGQIVVCPGVNDGAILDDTFAGILDQYPELDSVALVPLGISKFNREPAMRLHTVEEARAVVDAVADWQDVFQATLGRRMLYAADEYYLMAERPFPDAERYDGFPMHEDGIGMARTFEAEFQGRATQSTGVQRGFFAAVDAPPNPASYTALHQPVARGQAQRNRSADGGQRQPDAAPVRTGGGADRRARGAHHRPARRLARPDRHPRAAGRQRLLRRQHRGDRADHGRRRERRAGHPTRRPSLPAPRRVPVRRGTIPRRDHDRRTAPHRGSRADRRHLAAQRPERTLRNGHPDGQRPDPRHSTIG